MKPPEFIEIQYGYLRSKVARRIFFLFIICALIPLSALAYISFSQVTDALYLQADSRLHQACKASGMSIFEHLSFLEDELEMISANIHKGKVAFLQPPTKKFRNSLKERFKGLVLMTAKGQFIPLFGEIQILPTCHDPHHRTGAAFGCPEECSAGCRPTPDSSRLLKNST